MQKGSKAVKSKLIKSKDRARDHGEVFTPAHIVKDMCDLIPSELWENIDTKFLEPCCGNGNILAEIAQQKFERCSNADEGLRALRSIYGIDILPDNVLESRARLLSMYNARFDAPPCKLLSAAEIVGTNIMLGNSLEIMDELWHERKELDNVKT